MVQSDNRLDFLAVWGIAQEIEGWLLETQAQALYDAAKAIPDDQAIVEIGSHRGKSTVILASAKRALVTLVAVDPFDDPRWGGGPESLQYFLDNLKSAGVADKVTLFRGLSEQAALTWKGPPIGFLWIDGAHDRASVIADIDGWISHTATGARIYIHDAFSAIGTTEAILARFLITRQVQYLGSVRTLAMFEKRNVGLAEACASSARLASRLPFFAQNLGIKLAQRRHWDWALELLRYDKEVGLI